MYLFILEYFIQWRVYLFDYSAKNSKNYNNMLRVLTLLSVWVLTPQYSDGDTIL